ncbi:MAG: galactitol-1-phosphate 5-dehydrogenase [Bryobacteraceae bacterium]|nr:galactitol-1-phosphate 5-dehydrogenase [Bryobacteraceae bacterium]
MQALLLEEYKRLVLTEMPRPEPGPGEVLVRVKACGICGSDVHGFDGSSGRRIPPLVMGHEAAGVVEAVGAGVTAFREGDRVTMDSTVSCGRCWFCRRGDINLCDNRQVLGVSCGDYRRHGAFAEYVSVPHQICYKLPATLPFERAAMIEAVSIAVHAAGITPIQLNDTAVVVGSGMIGLLVIQAVRLAGARRIVAVDLEDHKLELAKSLGATHTANPRRDNVPQLVRDLTEGRGADVAMEVVGATEPIRTAVDSVRKGATVTLVGNITPKIELGLQSVVTRQIRLQGSCASSGEYPACIDLMASEAIQVQPLISAKAPLADGPTWFDRLYAHEPNLMKVILEP